MEKVKAMNWKLFFRITWILTVIGIIILSLLPPANMNFQVYGNDKIGHTFAYAILSLNTLIVFQRWPLWLLIFTMIFFGIFLEFGQGLIPGRQPSFWDALANTTGVILGIAIYTRGKYERLVK
jgi:VanZ family protein